MVITTVFLTNNFARFSHTKARSLALVVAKSIVCTPCRTNHTIRVSPHYRKAEYQTAVRLVQIQPTFKGLNVRLANFAQDPTFCYIGMRYNGEGIMII